MASLVHERVADDERDAHATAILLHLTAGVAGLVAMGLATLLQMSSVIAQGCGALAIVSLAVAATISRTGWLTAARLVSLTFAVACVIAMSVVFGGLGPVALLWLGVLPIEMALLGGLASVLAGLGAATICMLGFGAAMMWPGVLMHIDAGSHAMAYAASVATALTYALGLAMRMETRRAAALARIAEQESRFRLLAENSSDLITCHAANASTRFASGAAGALLGCEAEALLGSGMFERMHVQDRVTFRHAVARAAEDACDTQVEFRALGADGAYRWMEMRCRPALDANGAVSDVVAVTRDVSKAMHQTQLLTAAREEAERLSEAKSRFLAITSHELRTPLNAIIGFSDLIEQMDAALSDAKRLEYVRLIHGSGTHLLGVVNDILDASKIEAGGYELACEIFDAGDVARASVAMLEPVAAKGGVSIELSVRGAVQLDADARAFRQILTNLTGNAIKFSQPGAAVRVEVARDGRDLRLSVSDTGAGIADADIPRLGTPFTQVSARQDHAGHSRSHEGTGLGLSIVKGLVALHDGTFTIDSRKGEGTRVCVRLPLSRPQPTEASPVVVPLDRKTNTTNINDGATSMGAYQPDERYLDDGYDDGEGLGRLFMDVIREHPLLSTGALASIAVIASVSANALMFQPQAHPSPNLTTRAPIATEVTQVAQTTKAPTAPIVTAAVQNATDRELMSELQRALMERGYYEGAVDGIAGSRTRKAVEAFQRTAGLTVDGEASVRLLTKVVLTPARRSVPVPVPTYKVPAQPDQVETAAVKPVAGRNPDLVTAIQRGLRSYGYSEIEVDGKMGSMTSDAIRKFELDYALPSTGEPSKRVLQKLVTIGVLQQG